MSRYYQLIVFLTVYCIKNNCDQTESPLGYQLKCKNDACSESIGLVLASQKYTPDSVNKLKFNNEDKIDIFGVTVDGQYYFAKLGDRRGLVSRKIVRMVRQSYKDDDLILTHLDYSWKPVGDVGPGDGDSILHSTASSVDVEITSNAADDLTVSNSDLSPEGSKLVTDSPIEKLQTSFQPSNNQEEPTSSLDPLHDQIKTVESSIAVKSEEITKSQPEQAQFINIVPSSLTTPDPPSKVQATTEVAGTTFPLDAFDGEDLLDVTDEVSPQSSTPTPSIDIKPGINIGIQPSNLPSSSESIIQQSIRALNPSASVEMSKVSENVEPSVTTDQPKSPTEEIPNPSVLDDFINKVDQFLDSSSRSDTFKPSPEFPSSIVDDPTQSTPSPLPSEQNDADNPASREANSLPQSKLLSGDIDKETGFVDNPTSQPNETTETISENELSSTPATVEQVIGAQNGYTSNPIDSDQLTNNDRLDINAANESISEPQVTNQDQSSLPPPSASSSIDTPQDTKSIDRIQNNQGNLFHEESKIHEEGIKDKISSDEIHQKYGTEAAENHNKLINDSPSNYLPPSPLLTLPQQQQQQPPSPPSPPKSPILNQQQPLLHQNQYEPVHQHGHPNYHHQSVHQQQKRHLEHQQQPTINPNFDNNYYSQSDNPSDEMTRQLAADVESQSPPSPLSSSQEPVTADILSSSSSQSTESEGESSSHSPPSASDQDFESNLALPMQSSLLSNSASSSDQQSTFNGPSSESLKDTFTQTTFTETSVPTNYPDAMRSQIALLTTLLPEPMIDYLHHFNFSPSIFVILLMVTITWCVMFITSKILSSHKEKVSLEDQLCRNHGENFNLKTERDYLFDELAAEKEKNSRLLKEHIELKEKYESINHSIEHTQSEFSNIASEFDSLVKDNRIKTKKLEEVYEINENLKMESDEANKELEKVKIENEKLSKELEAKTNSLQLCQVEIVKMTDLNYDLEQYQASMKAKQLDLQNDLKKLAEYEETIEQLKIKLEEGEQEINSLKSFIDEEYHHNSTSESSGYSLESLLDGIKLKAELNVTQKQLESVKQEKDSIAAKIAEMESRMTKAEIDSKSAKEAKDEAERRLQILKTYFNEQEVTLQSELGTWKAKYESIVAQNESVPGYIEELKRSNEAFEVQVETLKREIAKREEKHRVDCSKLERDKHDLYMSKIRVENDLKNIKSECDILRKKLTLKSQGYSDEDLKHSTEKDGSSTFNLDSILPPPPPPTGYLEDTLDSSVGGVGGGASGPWSLGTIDPPPPFPVSWMNSSDSSTSGYSSLPPAPMPLQHQQQPSNHHYPTHHHPHPHGHYPLAGPPIPQPIRDTYSPTSQRSHDQRSVRSDISFSSTNNSQHHYSNYGPPPPPQTVQGPFSNPIPSHWSVNTQQQQQYPNQQQSTSHNESSTNYNDTRNYYTGGR